MVRAEQVELDEGPGVMLLLPRRGLLARLQVQHDIADACRIARLEHDIAGLAVPLVEQAERRDALRHRRRAEARIDAAADIDRHDVAGAGVRIERGLGRRFLGDATSDDVFKTSPDELWEKLAPPTIPQPSLN